MSTQSKRIKLTTVSEFLGIQTVTTPKIFLERMERMLSRQQNLTGFHSRQLGHLSDGDLIEIDSFSTTRRRDGKTTHILLLPDGKEEMIQSFWVNKIGKIMTASVRTIHPQDIIILHRLCPSGRSRFVSRDQPLVLP
jgi:hypothetical protein